MRAESYTFEDYIKDFELDYLGFEKDTDGSVSHSFSKNITENGPEQEGMDFGDDDQAPRPHFQKGQNTLTNSDM